MIVRHFLQWVRLAPSGERADATAMLARTYLYSQLSADDRAAAEGAMLMLLDDPSPLVRRALAESLAGSEAAPPAVILALANDQPDIAAIVLGRSPVLLDVDLVDAVATGTPATQAAIARRVCLPCSVAAAIAEVGSAEACLIVIENGSATVADFSIKRIIERHGELAAVREALLAGRDLPVEMRQMLVAKLSATLAQLATARGWLTERRAETVTREACEKATVTLATTARNRDTRPLIAHLRDSGQLTSGLLLRALLSGNMTLFEEALAELADMPTRRVAAVLHRADAGAMRALFDRAGLPVSILPAVRTALLTLREMGYPGDARGQARLQRRIVERVLTLYEDDVPDGSEAILTLLRRFAVEATREEARRFCDELAEQEFEDDRVAA